MNTAVIRMTNCLECPHSRVIPDPSFSDDFNLDDVALICRHMKSSNPDFDLHSNKSANRQPFRCITTACRPYNLHSEADIPDWCPLLENSKFINSCDKVVPEALRYLAEHERPSYGNDRFNSEHLYQLAKEFENSIK